MTTSACRVTQALPSATLMAALGPRTTFNAGNLPRALRYSNISTGGPSCLIVGRVPSQARPLKILLIASLLSFHEVVNALVCGLDRTGTLRHVISDAPVIYIEHFL